MSEVLESGVYEGMPLLPKPGGAYAPLFAKAELCPKCAGHGGWILKKDAYGPGEHFYGGCDHCNGWGWAEPSACVHEFHYAKSVGRCLSEWACAKCGVVRRVDSSD